MAKKKAKEVIDDVSEEMDAISEESDSYYNATAYLPVYNEEKKRYDMFLVRIDTVRKKAFVEVEPTRYDTETRALHDVMKRTTDDFIKKPKKGR
jgi:hypothetical protein